MSRGTRSSTDLPSPDHTALLATIAELQERLNAQESVTSLLQTQLQTARELSSSPSQSQSASHTSHLNYGREPKVNNPETYSGERAKLSNFLAQVQLVINLQPSRFASESAKIFFTGSYLRGTAFTWFQPLLSKEPKPSYMLDFAQFCQQLRATFGDPDEVSTAERQIRALR